MRTNVLFLFTVAGLVSCRSGGLGSAPEALVELYDLALPTGVIELELDRDGRVREMEADVHVDRLPQAVREAALAKAPGARITGAERELTDDGWMWEVKLSHEGRDWEFVMDDEGGVHESEKSLLRSEWPKAVVSGADAALPGGVTTSVEIVAHGEESAYHVKKEREGARYKLVLDGEGKLLRKVREQRAEIEIPLAD